MNTDILLNKSDVSTDIRKLKQDWKNSFNVRRKIDFFGKDFLTILKRYPTLEGSLGIELVSLLV